MSLPIKVSYLGLLIRMQLKVVVAVAYIGLFSGLAVAQAITPDEINRGAYLSRIGDCGACHTAGPLSPSFAGGLAINSPFGIIYSTNITPDTRYGIGNYTLSDFSMAVRNGIAKDGRHLYPAMPYPSYAAISDNDIRALYAYFMQGVQPVNQKPPETKLPFPFSLRWSLIVWNALFVKDARFQPHVDRDVQWNRGAYLVQSLGHCGACHTPRGLAYQETAYAESSSGYLTGAEIDNWFAANLVGDRASGLGEWSETDIAEFLGTGHGRQFSAFGSMTAVIENSTQYLYQDDLNAIAHYLKSLPAHYEKSAFRPEVAELLSAKMIGERELPGVGIYSSLCEKCHLESGNGKPNKSPKLAGNPIVLSENPMSLIHLLIEGGKTAHTTAGLPRREMPGFSRKLTDREIAEVLSYIRNSWGNKATPVTTRQVTFLRNAVEKK